MPFLLPPRPGELHVSSATNQLLGEFNKLQHRLDELRVLLRKEIAGEELPTGEFYVLVSRTEGEMIGMLIQHVDEVLPLCQLTAMPDSAPWVAGLLNLGGEMVPVLDLSVKISKHAHELELSDLIIVCQVDGKRLGVIVKEVLGVEQLVSTRVQAVPENVSFAPYLLGAAEIEHHAVLILNMPSVSSGLGLEET